MEPTTETEREPQTQNRETADRGQDESPRKRDFRERRRSALANPRFRLGLIVVLVVLVAAAIVAWRYFGSYESTDDAQIDGHLNSISPRVSGHVLKLNVQDNQ